MWYIRLQYNSGASRTTAVRAMITLNKHSYQSCVLKELGEKVSSFTYVERRESALLERATSGPDLSSLPPGGILLETFLFLGLKSRFGDKQPKL